MFEEFWWIIPIVMMALCLYMMGGKKDSHMCGFGSHKKDNHSISASNSAMEILGKRYALGEMDGEEYEEKKKALNHSG